MKIADAAQVLADRYTAFAKFVTDKRTLVLLLTFQAVSLSAVAMFGDEVTAWWTVKVNGLIAIFNALQVKAREWLALAGPDMPKPVDPSDEAGA